MGGPAGDEEFVAFVEADGPYLFRTAYFLVGERALAEDLVQGTFERVYRRWDKARVGEPRAYARKVLVNLRTDTWRRTRLTDVPGDEHLPVGHADDHAARVSLRDELARALGRLSPQQRRVVLLRHVLDLPEEQVAREIGRSVGTVKSASSRGLERLRALLAAGVPETVDEPAFDGRAALDRSKAAAARRTRREAALGVAAVAVCAFVALVVHGPVGAPALDAVTGPAHRWLVETFRLPAVDVSDEGPVRDENPVSRQDDAVGLGDLDIPGAPPADAAACAGKNLPTPEATRPIPVPGGTPTGDFTIVRVLDAADARPAIECVDHVTEHRVHLGSPPDVAVGSGLGPDPDAPFAVRRDGTLVAALARPDAGPGSEPVTALARPAGGPAGESVLEHWQLTTASSATGAGQRGGTGVAGPVLTDTHVAWTTGDPGFGPVAIRAQEPDGEVRTVATYEPDPARQVRKIAAGGRTLAVLLVPDDNLSATDRCQGRVDLVDLRAPEADVVRDVVTDVCAISGGDDGVVVSRNPAAGPSAIGLLTADTGLRDLVELDQDLAWNHYPFLSGDTLLFEWDEWMVALDTRSREATVVREDAGWAVGANDDGVLWADGEDILFLRLAPREGAAVPALTLLGPGPRDDGTSWLAVGTAADRVVWTEHAAADLEHLQSQDSWGYGDLEQTLVYVRTAW